MRAKALLSATYTRVALCPGPPARRNKGAAVLRRFRAGTTATFKSIDPALGCSRSIGTRKVPQRAATEVKYSGCSSRHSLVGRIAESSAAAGRAHHAHTLIPIHTNAPNRCRMPPPIGAIVWDSLPMLAHNLIDLRHDRHSRSRCDCERSGRPAVHFLLPHARFHPRHGPRL